MVTRMADRKVQEIQPLEGKTSADDKMTFEPERLSYKASGQIALWIAERIRRGVAGKVVVIAGDRLLADLANLSSNEVQLEMLAADFKAAATLVAPRGAAAKSATSFVLPVAPAVAAVAPAITSALGLVGLFREDVEFKGTATNVAPLAFEVALAAAVKQYGAKKVFVPDLTVVSTQSGQRSLTAQWKEVRDAREAAWRAAGPLIADLAKKEADLDEASQTGNAGQITILSNAVFLLRRTLEPVTEILGGADRRLSELQAQWNSVDEITGVTMLARLLRAEALKAFTPTYVHAAVVSSGGHNRVSRNLFRMLLFGDGLSSMGGVVVRWALFENDGGVTDGGIRTARVGARFPMQIFDEELGNL